MFLFTKLLFAHLLAEYPLQTPKIFEWKTKYFWGVVLHVTFYGVGAVIFALPEILKDVSILYFILFTYVIHIIVDEGKNIYIRKTGRDDIYAFVVDQILHILTLLLLFVVYPTSLTGKFSLALVSVIQSAQDIFSYLIAIVFVSYTTSIIIYYIHRTYFNRGISYLRDFKDMILRTALFVLLSQGLVGGTIATVYLVGALLFPEKDRKPYVRFYEGFNFVFCFLGLALFLYLASFQ